MKTAEAVEALKGKMGNAIEKEEVFHDQTSLAVRKDNLIAILSFFKEAGFQTLMDLTGIDYLEPIKGTQVVYMLHNPENFQRIWIALFASREEKIPSVISLWEGADWYERELFDLFGVNFEGHPDLKRILMPDDWKGHPLRRDYALTEEAVEFKHGVKPKVPSDIIHIKRSQKYS